MHWVFLGSDVKILQVDLQCMSLQLIQNMLQTLGKSIYTSPYQITVTEELK